MKRLLVTTVGIGVLLLSAQAALADTYVLNDTGSGSTGTGVYWGGDPTGSGDRDRIGTSKFEIYSITVSYSGSGDMVFRVYTNFVDGANGNSNLGAEMGDLFISTDGWGAHSDGSSTYSDAPEYSEDYWGQTGHEVYEYAITMDDYTWNYTSNGAGGIGSASGTAKLYDVSGGTVKLSNDFFSSGYRADQEVRFVAGGSQSATATGSWSVGSDSGGYYLEYVIAPNSDLIDAWNDGLLGVHWAMTCANDVAAGAIVPEPATLVLLGAALGGFGLRTAARRRRRVSA